MLGVCLFRFNNRINCFKFWNKLNSNIEYNVSVVPVQVGDNIFIGTTNTGVLKKTYSGGLLD